jgi:hypothetical protein
MLIVLKRLASGDRLSRRVSDSWRFFLLLRRAELRRCSGPSPLRQRGCRAKIAKFATLHKGNYLLKRTACGW